MNQFQNETLKQFANIDGYSFYLKNGSPLNLRFPLTVMYSWFCGPIANWRNKEEL